MATTSSQAMPSGLPRVELAEVAALAHRTECIGTGSDHGSEPVRRLDDRGQTSAYRVVASRSYPDSYKRSASAATWRRPRSVNPEHPWRPPTIRFTLHSASPWRISTIRDAPSPGGKIRRTPWLHHAPRSRQLGHEMLELAQVAALEDVVAVHGVLAEDGIAGPPVARGSGLSQYTCRARDCISWITQAWEAW